MGITVVSGVPGSPAGPRPGMAMKLCRAEAAWMMAEARQLLPPPGRPWHPESMPLANQAILQGSGETIK